MSIIEDVSIRKPAAFEHPVAPGRATSHGPIPKGLDQELVRAVNEKVAIITGFADRLLESQELDEIGRAAVEAIQRQARGLREIAVRS